jgi:threonine synthase
MLLHCGFPQILRSGRRTEDTAKDSDRRVNKTQTSFSQPPSRKTVGRQTKNKVESTSATSIAVGHSENFNEAVETLIRKNSLYRDTVKSLRRGKKTFEPTDTVKKKL